jgi:hypothetical protein
VAEGPPATLGEKLGQETLIRFRLTNGLTADQIAAAIGRQPELSGNQATLATTEPQRDLRGLLDWAANSGVQLADLEVRRPSLEDVFLTVTGNPEENGR